MLLKIIGLSILLSTVQCMDKNIKFLDDLSDMKDDAISKLIQLSGGPSNSAVTDYFCDLAHLNSIQYGFSNYLGIDTSLTWKNATTLYSQVDAIISQSMDGYQKVCQARKMFYNGMGATYSDCTNPLFLAGHLPPGGNLTMPYAYSALWQQLDFICNGGLFIGLQSYKDLMSVYSTPAGLKCYSDFMNSIMNNQYDMCGAVGTFMLCEQEAYVKMASNRPNGWWICERIRVGYAPYCFNLRCTVLTT